MTLPMRMEAPEPRRLLSSFVVSPAGNDSAAGSAAAPWRTLQHAADSVSAGDNVTVLPGTYTGFQLKSSGTSALPIVFSAQKGATITSPNFETPDGINLEGASFITIEGFTVVGMPRAGIRAVSDQSVKILNNTADQNNYWGIFTGFSENVDIENNTASGSTIQHGIYVSNSADNPIIRGNTVFGNATSGIQINADASQGGDGIISNALIESNTIYGNGVKGGSAINLDGVQDSTIQNNLLYDNHASGISMYRIDGGGPSTNNSIINNTIIMAADARWAINIRDSATGAKVINNIILTLSAHRGGLSIAGDSLAGLVSDYNAGIDRFSLDAGDHLLDLADWQMATKQDQHSFAADATSLFNDPSRNDYHLSPASPAVDAGMVQGAAQRDLEGHARPRGNGTDIGAYESTFAATPIVRIPAGPASRYWNKLSGKLHRHWEMAVTGLVLAAATVGWTANSLLRRRGMNRWLGPYLRQTAERRPPKPDEPVHVLLCITDHYEPRNGDVSATIGMQRVESWANNYPRLFNGFRDSDGRPPRHSFFYPMEEYHAQEVETIAGLCRAGYGEIEIHLHHDNDTSENLRQCLLRYKTILSDRHGMLSRSRGTGELAYGFIHGNWTLDNSHPQGLMCGVNNELDILRETGCYADFTMPSTLDGTQTRKINSIYRAVDDPDQPRSHDTGVDVGDGPPPPDSLMLIQGPLLLSWKNRKLGLIPRIENGCIQGNQPPTMARLDQWLTTRVQVPNRPDWFFVKLHTHGATEYNQQVLLGKKMAAFHAALAERARQNPNFHYHYVTAREMYNLVRAAESHHTGSVAEARDFELISRLATK